MNKLKKGNKSIIILMMVIMAITITFFIPNQIVLAGNAIGTKKAKNIALSDIGMTNKSVSGLKCKTDYSDKEYEVTFKTSVHKYEFDISMNTGKIKSIERKRINKDKKYSGTKLTTTKVKNIALKDAGISSNKAKKLKIKLKTSKTYKYYKVEFKAGAYEYEYEINAYTGTINEMEREI